MKCFSLNLRARKVIEFLVKDTFFSLIKFVENSLMKDLFKINLNNEVKFSFVCFLLCLYRESHLRSGSLDYSGSKSDTRIYM